jgi:hypothetical protein
MKIAYTDRVRNVPITSEPIVRLSVSLWGYVKVDNIFRKLVFRPDHGK